jgi:transposase InsO family protein
VKVDTGEPDFAWAGDITYVPTGEGWLYVASVLDLGSRRLVGYAMDDNMATPLVAGALEQAVELRGGAHGVIFHSDRGSPWYLSRDYRKLCERLGVRQSAARVRTCFDNSVAEAFWAAFKRELVHRYRFATRAEAKPPGRGCPSRRGSYARPTSIDSSKRMARAPTEQRIGAHRPVIIEVVSDVMLGADPIRTRTRMGLIPAHQRSRAGTNTSGLHVFATLSLRMGVVRCW